MLPVAAQKSIRGGNTKGADLEVDTRDSKAWKDLKSAKTKKQKDHGNLAMSGPYRAASSFKKQ